MRYSKGNIPPIPSVAPSMLFPHKKALLHGEELVLTPFLMTQVSFFNSILGP